MLSHSFLGAAKVVEALSECRGWDEGFVSLQQGDYQRDPVTRQINGIIQSQSQSQ